VTMIRPPADAPAQSSPDPLNPGGQRVAGLHIRVTTGGYLLGVLAAGAGALILPAVTPGRPVASYLAATGAVVVILLASILAHELGHAVVVRRYRGQAGATVGFFGGIGHGRADLPSARAQWQVAVAGPLVSLLLTGVSLAALAALGGPGRTSTLLPATVAAAAAWINGLLAGANLIPAAGLDGGRIVRALAWARSGDPTRAILVSARFGQVAGAILTAAGITAVVLHHLTGVWAVLLGVLMITASRVEAGQAMTSAALAGLRVRDILPVGQAAPVARGWQSVQSFLEGDSELGLAPAPPGVTAFAVRDFDGQLTGLVTRSQLSAVPRARRPVTRLSQAATPVDHLVFSTPDEPLTTLRARLNGRAPVPAALYTAGHVLVLGTGGELAGLLTPADFTRAAELRAGTRASTRTGTGAERGDPPAPPGPGGAPG
jgi:Zn-dependent protease